MSFEAGAVVRAEDQNGWAVVLVLESLALGDRTQRCLCLDGTRSYTPSGNVASWYLDVASLPPETMRLERIA